MKFGIFSDLHLEFELWLTGAEPEAKIFINAGDTHPQKIMRDYAQEIYPGVHVMGNHDYYGSEFPRPGDGQTLTKIGDLVIAAATLWTSLDAEAWTFYVDGLIDSRRIRGLTREAYDACYRSDLQFIKESNADVVVTHHSPTMRGCHPRWGNHVMNKCFHNELDWFIMDMKKPPRLWIHGHTHDACNYVVGETRVVCHPRGYPGETNFKGYAPLYLDI